MTNIRMNFPWTENFYFILATTLLKNFNSYPPPPQNKRGGGAGITPRSTSPSIHPIYISNVTSILQSLSHLAQTWICLFMCRPSCWFSHIYSICVELIYYKMKYIVMHLFYRKVYMCILAKIFYVLFVIVVSTLQKIFMLIFDLVYIFQFL